MEEERQRGEAARRGWQRREAGREFSKWFAAVPREQGIWRETVRPCLCPSRLSSRPPPRRPAAFFSPCHSSHCLRPHALHVPVFSSRFGGRFGSFFEPF